MEKIGIAGRKRDIIFFKAIGFEIFPTEERDINEILDFVEKREDLGMIFLDQDLISKIEKERLEELQKKTLPVIVFIPFKETKETPGIREIMKKAIGQEEAVAS